MTVCKRTVCFFCGVAPVSDESLMLCDDCRRKPPEPAMKCAACGGRGWTVDYVEVHSYQVACHDCDGTGLIGGLPPAAKPTPLATDQAALDAILEAAFKAMVVSSNSTSWHVLAERIAHAVATALDELAAKRAAR